MTRLAQGDQVFQLLVAPPDVGQVVHLNRRPCKAPLAYRPGMATLPADHSGLGPLHHRLALCCPFRRTQIFNIPSARRGTKLSYPPFFRLPLPTPFALITFNRSPGRERDAVDPLDIVSHRGCKSFSGLHRDGFHLDENASALTVVRAAVLIRFRAEPQPEFSLPVAVALLGDVHQDHRLLAKLFER